ncbi:alpha/beta hydrolase [Pleurocapsales cyanobacterium LEGE 10410]|nr:alpha/beta hydrolase [Pleurocapsales cyanobacterium LEGE 10410]
MSLEQLEQIITQLREEPLFENLELAELRAKYEEIAASFPTPTDAIIKKVNALGVPGQLVLAAGASDLATIVYLHGGGYAMGSLNTHRTLAYNLSQASGFQVLQVDYRLAPEHPFPAALQDSVTTIKWLRQNGLPAKQIGMAGDSAGGGLALATCLVLRDAGEELPAAVVCISPWTDLAAQGESMQSKASVDPLISSTEIEYLRNLYLKDENARHPLASPLYADLAGLPPLLFQVGSDEILLDDSTRLVAKAKQAGVEVELKIWEKMIHVWHFFAPILTEGQEAIAEAASFLQKHLKHENN